jgi:uncharacterized protein YlxW (UPF0749 family)
MLSSQQMEHFAMHVPMPFLTAVAMFCVALLIQMDADLLSKGFVMVTALCTLIVAMVKRKTERRNQEHLREALEKLIRLEIENELLRQQNETFQAERKSFRQEIRSEVAAIKTKVDNQHEN